MEQFKTVHRRGVSRTKRTPVRVTGWVQLTFWFISREEKGLFLLADELKRAGYRVRMKVRRSAPTIGCSATGWIHVRESELNRTCLEMFSLADRYRVIFDRWAQCDERFRL